MLNTAVVERHGMSPLFFFFGRQPRLPASPANSPEALDPAALEFVLSFKTRLQEALDVGRLAQSHLIEKMDKRRDPGHALVVGDWAYVDAEITPIPGNPHFRVKYAGPFLSRPSPPPLPPLTSLNTGKSPQIRSTWISSRNMSCATETHCRHARVVLPAGRLLIKGSLRGSHIIAGWVELERMADARTSNFMFIGKSCLVPIRNG
jgi:hypothetical protein